MEEPEITAWNNHLHCNPQWAAPHCLQFELCFFPPAPCHQYRQMGLVCIAMASLMKCLDLWWLKETLSLPKSFGRSSKTSFRRYIGTCTVNGMMIPTNVANLKYRSNIKSLKQTLFSASRETPLVSGSRTRTKTSRRGCCAMLCALYDSPNTVKQQCLVINQPELVHEAPTRATTQKSMYMPQFHVIAWLGGLITPYSWGVSDTLTHKPLPRNL